MACSLAYLIGDGLWMRSQGTGAFLLSGAMRVTGPQPWVRIVDRPNAVPRFLFYGLREYVWPEEYDRGGVELLVWPPAAGRPFWAETFTKPPYVTRQTRESFERIVPDPGLLSDISAEIDRRVPGATVDELAYFRIAQQRLAATTEPSRIRWLGVLRNAAFLASAVLMLLAVVILPNAVPRLLFMNRQARAGRCVCGYPIDGLTDGLCPECGSEIPKR